MEVQFDFTSVFDRDVIINYGEWWMLQKTFQTKTVTVADWFDEITTESFDTYYPNDQLDLCKDTTGTSYDDVNAPAIFGFGSRSLSVFML
jgi:hypothetical protein